MDSVSVVNLALLEMGNRVQINSFNDASPTAQAARLLFQPKISMLARSAPWGSWRGQITLTQLKAALINGTLSSDPPPQPWQFEYAWPPDCLYARFVMPTMNSGFGSGPPLTTAPNINYPQGTPPTACPFVTATDFDSTGNSNRVILTNVPQAQLVYTRDLVHLPDLWDPMFLAAATATLASFFIAALANDKAKLNQQLGIARSMIEQARMMSAEEGISSIDTTAEWIRARRMSSVPWLLSQGGGPNGVVYSAYDQFLGPEGISF
jgi:hypothetical protein